MALRFDRGWLALGLGALLILGSGCEKAKTEKAPAQAGAEQAGGMPGGGGGMPGGGMPGGGMPGGRPPGMMDAQGPTDNNPIPIKMTGNNSLDELKRDLAKLGDAPLKQDFENAYRYAFSAKIAQRNYGDAIMLAQKIIATKPDFAPAYRVLGYAYVNTGQMGEAMGPYMKAVEIDPNYGEAHYALAFMYAMNDPAKGAEHYRKAMQLGVPDERNLGAQFYSNVK